MKPREVCGVEVLVFVAEMTQDGMHLGKMTQEKLFVGCRMMRTLEAEA
jgi:hypothetical protein